MGEGCIGPLCDLLGATDVRVQNVVLEALESILKAGEVGKSVGMGRGNKYADPIEEAGGLEDIEVLETHQNVDVYNKAVHILETYFGVEEEGETQLAPTLSEGRSAYDFGLTQTQDSVGMDRGFIFG